jgi:pyruvate/2-oxoglutarate dehydrogenase complex dihydrolipoamide dehydrogenase (E3) component
MSVAVIERGLVGGMCVNTGCTPTKTLVASAEATHIALRATDFGVSIAGPVGIDMKCVNARKDAAVNVSGVLALGGCNRKGARTHRAYDDFEIVATNLLADDPRRVNHRILCYVMYAKASYAVMQRTMHNHPTVSEHIPGMLGELRPP